jgi:hypothetical protein
MTTPTIQALGVTQEGASTRWRAAGDVEGIGRLAAWGTNLPTALAALQALRNGNDRDGRRYTIEVRATDEAGNEGDASTVVTVPRK